MDEPHYKTLAWTSLGHPPIYLFWYCFARSRYPPLLHFRRIIFKQLIPAGHIKNNGSFCRNEAQADRVFTNFFKKENFFIDEYKIELLRIVYKLLVNSHWLIITSSRNWLDSFYFDKISNNDIFTKTDKILDEIVFNQWNGKFCIENPLVSSLQLNRSLSFARGSAFRRGSARPQNNTKHKHV